jgi:hypothetical protein
MIPDDEPWWMVRCKMQGDGSVAAAESPARELSPGIAERQQAIKAEPASETLQALDALPFRPIGYEW